MIAKGLEGVSCELMKETERVCYAMLAAPRTPNRNAFAVLGGGAGGRMICQLRCRRSMNAEAILSGE